MKIQNTFNSYDALTLVKTEWKDTYVQDMFFTHYPHSGGMVGRRLIYKIGYRNKICGLIAIQSCAMVSKVVMMRLYGIPEPNKFTRLKYLSEVYSNNIFRLEYQEPNLASRVLAMFRARAQQDMKREYGQHLRAIISLTYGLNEEGVMRSGKCYKADNWEFLGLSKGYRIHHGYAKEGEKTEWNVEHDGEKKYFWLYDFDRRRDRFR